MVNSLKKNLALPVSLTVSVIILVAVPTVQLSTLMVASGDATGNAYAKYSNNLAQSLVNDCDVFHSDGAPNCQNVSVCNPKCGLHTLMHWSPPDW